MLKHLGKEASADYKKVTELKNDLEQSIAIILGESLTQVKSKGQGSYDLKVCKWHDKLVAELAEKGDAIISFNYDCVIDDSLRRHGGGKWNPHYGYGLKLKPSGPALKGEAYWTPEHPSKPERNDTIKVHKVHGSLHFKKEGNEYEMKNRPYANPHAKTGNMKFKIIAPESSKSYEDGNFGVIMKNAYQSLRKATRVIVIGYSLPLSDQHAESLFRFGIKKNALDALVIVNPDKSARSRIRSAIQNGLKPSTRVLSFDYLEEFVQAEPAILKI
jgi:hypothetical protein